MQRLTYISGMSRGQLKIANEIKRGRHLLRYNYRERSNNFAMIYVAALLFLKMDILLHYINPSTRPTPL
jgi:hypothetical protein